MADAIEVVEFAQIGTVAIEVSTAPEDIVVYAMIDRVTNIVTNRINWDKTQPWTGDTETDFGIQSDTAQIGWTYADGAFTAPPVVPPTPAEILFTNTRSRDGMLAAATLAIAPLQDAVDLDDATDADTALLKKWKQYRVAVNRIDLTLAAPSWPVAPA